MRTYAVRAVLATFAVLFVTACSESPTQPSLNLRPQFSTEVGSSATWVFKATIYSLYHVDFNLGDEVKGTITFTITDPDVHPSDPCIGNYPADITITYAVNGVTYRRSGEGRLIAWRDCAPNVDGPAFQINTFEDGWIWALTMYNPADSKDFPLVPPPLSSEFSNTFVNVRMASYPLWKFVAKLTYLVANPPDKAACKDGGWSRFGFVNQGQCVRFIETGKDSRDS